MTRWVFTLSLFLLLSSALALGVTDEEISAARALFPEGRDVAVTLSEEGRAALESAIEVLEAALGVTVLFDHTDETAYMALDIDLDKKPWVNALTQGYYTWGDVFLEDDEAKKTAFIRGQYWGLKSLRMSSAFATEEVQHNFIEAVHQGTDVPALFWTYGNWSRKDEYDPLGAIARNDLPKLEALIERVFETEPTYSANGPYRALAAFWGGLPPLPLYKYGQNLPRALSYLCPVLNEPGYCVTCGNCPAAEDVDDYFENRLIFAQYYLMEKKLWEDAARVLQSILEDPIGERFMLYNAYCVERAQVLLDEVVEHL
ncbi:TRAP transporter TatT component family protein [Candidatus Bipolaricaulota bacterium]